MSKTELRCYCGADLEVRRFVKAIGFPKVRYWAVCSAKCPWEGPPVLGRKDAKQAYLDHEQRYDISRLLSLFHHIHHENGKHEVHHCGGLHAASEYTIAHCSCSLHSVNRQIVVGHASVRVAVRFTEICPDGGWHMESGIVNSIGGC